MFSVNSLQVNLQLLLKNKRKLEQYSSAKFEIFLKTEQT